MKEIDVPPTARAMSVYKSLPKNMQLKVFGMIPPLTAEIAEEWFKTQGTRKPCSSSRGRRRSYGRTVFH